MSNSMHRAGCCCVTCCLAGDGTQPEAPTCLGAGGYTHRPMALQWDLTFANLVLCTDCIPDFSPVPCPGRSLKFITAPSVGPNGTFRVTRDSASATSSGGHCKYVYDSECTGLVREYSNNDCTGDETNYNITDMHIDFWITAGKDDECIPDTFLWYFYMFVRMQYTLASAACEIVTLEAFWWHSWPGQYEEQYVEQPCEDFENKTNFWTDCWKQLTGPEAGAGGIIAIDGTVSGAKVL